ncbi:iron chelate uptake ABC transporter family permease subunit [Actinoplanes bogorensis]|uniref:Iron chelate uptake ABC transporter family permease subunit n=1 Tax=Paractinoplanes bogorensis TaxID=1610840 RepID=A0ABS5YZL4_9ACTN|nr:iron chelate uptake ABC transporter family permease subunit [Actinoplanes bogorensis]MBU2668862.1 iron chelate uptake ABC transporter family permease subunit [Actinoplanes bogorensis]
MTAVLTAPAQPRDRRRQKRWIGLAVALTVLFVVIALSVAIGSRSIDLATVWRVLWHADDSPESAIVHDLRLPRTVLGIAVGAALGLAGTVMQALTRNPLAEPGLLGVNLGASTGVVIAIAFLGVGSAAGYVWFAFAGAALVSAAVFALGGAGRHPTPERQILAGISITSVLGAIVWAILVLRREAFDRYRHWDVGSFSDREAGTVLRILPFVAAGVVLALLLGRRLNALSLGDESATSLGASPVRIRALGLLAVTLLCGAATAAAGPIWFLGLAVPYTARMIVGSDHRWILAYAVVLGPALLLGADVLGRVLVAPAELPVGVVTAFLGAPLFIALCRRRRLSTL